jgi:FkbM family methyltransferase
MIWKNKFSQTIDKWFSENGDYHCLREHNLAEADLVVDIGAYKGQWLLDMNRMYGCKGIGFEPLKEFTKSNKFPEEIKIFNFALGKENKVEKIHISGDGSSISESGNRSIKIKDAADHIKDLEISVLMINIEGYEYDLVPYLIEKKCLDKVKRMQIQFHRIKGIRKKDMERIIASLEKIGFKTKFHYEFVWWGGARDQ